LRLRKALRAIHCVWLRPVSCVHTFLQVRAALVAIGPSLPLLDDSLDATSHVRVLLPPNPFPPHLAPFGTAEISNSGPIAEPNTGPILPAYSYVSASSNRNRKRKLLLWDQIPPSSDLPRLPTNAATGASTGAGSTFMAKFSSSEVSSWMPHHQMMSSELAREIRILLHSVLMAAVHTSSSGQGENGAVNSIHSTVRSDKRKLTKNLPNTIVEAWCISPLPYFSFYLYSITISTRNTSHHVSMRVVFVIFFSSIPR